MSLIRKPRFPDNTKALLYTGSRVLRSPGPYALPLCRYAGILLRIKENRIHMNTVLILFSILLSY